MEALSLLYRKTIFSKSMICKIQRDDNFYDLWRQTKYLYLYIWFLN